jgi:hypothetical protein
MRRLALIGVVLLAGIAPASSQAAPATIPHGSETISDPTAPGVAVNGVIFIRERYGYGRCSGTSVVAPDRSLVVTAGHCVFDEGHWMSRHWVFVPGYEHGERPFGTFTAHWLGTTPGWFHSGNFNFDVGAAVVGRNERGQLLAQAVGADRLVTGRNPRQAYDVYGYPVARPFNGSTLQVCRGASFAGHDLPALLEPGPLEFGVSCPISAGASGGGWVVDGDLLDGVTSNSYSDDAGTTYGPYFGEAVAKLVHRAGRIR